MFEKLCACCKKGDKKKDRRRGEVVEDSVLEENKYFCSFSLLKGQKRHSLLVRKDMVRKKLNVKYFYLNNPN